MADTKVKGVPSKVIWLITDAKFVFLKRQGQKESRVQDIPVDGDLGKILKEGRLVKTSDLDMNKIKTYEQHLQETNPTPKVENPVVAEATASPEVAPTPENPLPVPGVKEEEVGETITAPVAAS